MQNLTYINPHPISVLDIGCNVGQFYHHARQYWPNAYYFLIDGNQNVEEDIKQLNVDYKIALLSDEEKEVILYINKDNLKCTGTSIYKETSHAYDGCLEKKAMTKKLDDMFNDKSFELIKIDTQGSEIDILKGGLNLIKNTKYIILETSIVEYNKNSPFENEVIKFMDEIGFEKKQIIDSRHFNNKHIQNDILFERK